MRALITLPTMCLRRSAFEVFINATFSDCDCSNYGSVDNDCDPCTRLCTCKPNVTGRRCDECEAEHYGIEGGEGCLRKYCCKQFNSYRPFDVISPKPTKFA